MLETRNRAGLNEKVFIVENERLLPKKQSTAQARFKSEKGYNRVKIVEFTEEENNQVKETINLSGNGLPEVRK